MLMNKKTISLAVLVLVIIAAGVASLFFYRGFAISKEKVEISSVLGGSDPEVQLVSLDKDGAFMSITKDQTTEKRGLKDFEADEVRQILKELRITSRSVDAKTACGKDLPAADTYLEINDEKRKGTVFFCDGVGADEAGNINGPYKRLLDKLDELSA